ncbi:hypothetical protein OAF16_04635 [Flavobacteriales bacterium]|nr:hypothetical protein [Flavobacteriales bacterium]
MKIKLANKHIEYLNEQLTNNSILFGTPVYKSINACVLASLVGFKENYRSAYIKNNDNIMVFACGKLLPIQITK